MTDQERYPLRWAHFPHLGFPIRQDAVMTFHYFEAARFLEQIHKAKPSRSLWEQVKRWRSAGRMRELADQARLREAA